MLHYNRPREGLSTNACGSSSSSDQMASFPSRVKLEILMFGANSFSTWRHAPQGGVGSLSSVAMAISSKSVSPCDTAEAIARVSAQIACPYAEFSMLHPT